MGVGSLTSRTRTALIAVGLIFFGGLFIGATGIRMLDAWRACFG